MKENCGKYEENLKAIYKENGGCLRKLKKICENLQQKW